MPPVPGITSTSSPSRRATSAQILRELADLERQDRSPGESVLTSDASQAPVPEAGKITTGPVVWKTRFSPSSTSRPSAANSAPRWSIVGCAIARSTRSGVLVGPGI